ncbi:MAG TPA: lysoplasmalogenase [Chitinophagaceae bacterium]|nr:lysoplasmalogenase [Chitinophagaceae bacterium]
MNKNFWIIVYILVLAADLFAVYTGNETLRYITKPLLMPLLIIYFMAETNSFISSLKKWIVLALTFSLAGDVFLMFESKNSNFFIFGLVTFLIAHIFYILFFENVIRKEGLRKNYWWFLPVIIYYIALIYILSPNLGDLKLPVRFYGIVISYMLIQALQAGRIRDLAAATFMIGGAVLFITSDSILAINKFYEPFEYAGIAIMLTYGIAQLLITLGAVRYISSSSKQ